MSQLLLGDIQYIPARFLVDMAAAKKGIPEWQRQRAPAPTEEDIPEAADAPTEDPTEAQAPPEPASREALVEKARAFLDHEEIRDSTTESKISFLEQKGLTNGEIHGLLGISRNDATAPEPAADVPGTSPSSEIASTTSTAPQESSPKSSSAPPIITYPEFLLHAQKPPPLITPSHALNAIYASSLVAASFYVASAYVVQPMLASLTEARHDFFGSTREKLGELNAKLETVVSTIPPTASTTIAKGPERGEGGVEGNEDDASSVASDPTELFHRDIGVQTSIPPSPTSSRAGSTTSSTSGRWPSEDSNATKTAQSRLSSIKQSLNEMRLGSDAAYDDEEMAGLEIRGLHVYLEELRFGQGGTAYQSVKWNTVGGAKATPGMRAGSDTGSAIKTEIKAMKGILLSARNFPRSDRGVRS